MITVTKAATRLTDNGRVTFDANFLFSGFSRKIYIFPNDTSTFKSTPHHHDSEHYFVCTEGADARLAIIDQSGVKHIIKMEAAHWYFVPPKTPHQIIIKGRGILEAFSRNSTFRKAMAHSADPDNPAPITVLDEDLIDFES